MNQIQNFSALNRVNQPDNQSKYQLQFRNLFYNNYLKAFEDGLFYNTIMFVVCIWNNVLMNTVYQLRDNKIIAQIHSVQPLQQITDYQKITEIQTMNRKIVKKQIFQRPSQMRQVNEIYCINQQYDQKDQKKQVKNSEQKGNLGSIEFYFYKRSYNQKNFMLFSKEQSYKREMITPQECWHQIKSKSKFMITHRQKLAQQDKYARLEQLHKMNIQNRKEIKEKHIMKRKDQQTQQTFQNPLDSLYVIQPANHYNKSDCLSNIDLRKSNRLDKVQLNEEQLLKIHFSEACDYAFKQQRQNINKILDNYYNQCSKAHLQLIKQISNLIEELYLQKRSNKSFQLPLSIRKIIKEKQKIKKNTQQLSQHFNKFKSLFQNGQIPESQMINAFIWFIHIFNIDYTKKLDFIQTFIQTSDYLSSRKILFGQNESQVFKFIRNKVNEIQEIKKLAPLQLQKKKTAQCIQEFQNFHEIQMRQMYKTCDKLKAHLKHILNGNKQKEGRIKQYFEKQHFIHSQYYFMEQQLFGRKNIKVQFKNKIKAVLNMDFKNISLNLIDKIEMKFQKIQFRLLSQTFIQFTKKTTTTIIANPKSQDFTNIQGKIKDLSNMKSRISFNGMMNSQDDDQQESIDQEDRQQQNEIQDQKYDLIAYFFLDQGDRQQMRIIINLFCGIINIYLSKHNITFKWIYDINTPKKIQQTNIKQKIG